MHVLMVDASDVVIQPPCSKTVFSQTDFIKLPPEPHKMLYKQTITVTSFIDKSIDAFLVYL